MNYANLKSTMQAVVKTNGVGSITGANFQSVLLSMINTLGAGYQFIGLATPTTNPNTPADTRMFYIAKQSGSYTYFDDLEVSGLSILYYDTAWHLIDLGVITAIKTINNNSLVGSGNLQLRTIGGQNPIGSTDIEFKTIGSNSIVGSGNISLKTIDGQSIIGSGDIPVYYTTTTITDPTQIRLLPHQFHLISGAVTSLTILAVASDVDVMNEYILEFTTGSVLGSFTFPSAWVFPDNFAFAVNEHYRLKMINNYVTVDVWTPAIVQSAS